MKKIFSLFAAVLFAGSMMAESYSFTFAKGDLTTSTTEFTKSDVTWTLSNPETQWNGTAGKTGYVFGSAASPVTLTVSTSDIDGTIAQVSVIGRSNNKGKAAVVSVKVGDIDFSATDASWDNGDNQTAEFTGTAAGKIAVTITPDACGFVLAGISVEYSSGAVSVAKPVISGEAEFFDETEVSIACATDGAKIYYTLDGSEPSASSTEYAAAFKLKETATVKAIAIKGDDKSSIAEKEFSKKASYASIEALVEADPASETLVKVSFSDVKIDSIFVTKSEKRQGIYLNVLDKTGKKDVEIYYSAEQVPEAWVEGGKVSGSIIGTWKYYESGKVYEIIPQEGFKWADLTYSAGGATAIDNTAVEAKAVKTIENGMLIIEKAGVRYNVMGQVIR